MRNPFRNPARIDYEVDADGNFVWITDGGVSVSSTAEPVAPRWWDNPWLHMVWSYHSWTSTVLRSYGKQYGWMGWWKRPAYKVTYKNLEETPEWKWITPTRPKFKTHIHIHEHYNKDLR